MIIKDRCKILYIYIPVHSVLLCQQNRHCVRFQHFKQMFVIGRVADVIPGIEFFRHARQTGRKQRCLVVGLPGNHPGAFDRRMTCVLFACDSSRRAKGIANTSALLRLPGINEKSAPRALFRH